MRDQARNARMRTRRTLTTRNFEINSVNRNSGADFENRMGTFNGTYFGNFAPMAGDKKNGEEKCIVCFDRDPETCYHPCKHGGVCKYCAIASFKLK